MSPRLSIVIVNHHSERELEHCLRSMHSAGREAMSIILVDTTPGNGADRVLKASGLTGQYIVQARASWAEAASLGADHANGAFVCFLDPRLILSGHALERMMDWLEQHPRTIVGARQRDAAGQIVTSAYPFMTRRHVWWPRELHWMNHSARSWIAPSATFADLCQRSLRPVAIPVLDPHVVMTTTSVWNDVGEWPESFNRYSAAAEWFQTARDAGALAWYLPNAEATWQSVDKAKPMNEIAQRHYRRLSARRVGLLAVAVLVVGWWLRDAFFALLE